MAETAATRSAALALADERALMRQGYRFLDEKRVLLAAELLRRLQAHRTHEAALVAQFQAAAATLRAALQRHGLEGLQAYPAAEPAAAPATTRQRFLGVPLQESVLVPPPAGDAADRRAVDPSPEARACRAAFEALLAPLAALAASGGNLERLGAEYRRTERRARALENVLLPEVERALKSIDDHLELADQEETVRIRMAGRLR